MPKRHAPVLAHQRRQGPVTGCTAATVLLGPCQHLATILKPGTARTSIIIMCVMCGNVMLLHDRSRTGSTSLTTAARAQGAFRPLLAKQATAPYNRRALQRGLATRPPVLPGNPSCHAALAHTRVVLNRPTRLRSRRARGRHQRTGCRPGAAQVAQATPSDTARRRCTHRRLHKL